MIRKPIRKKIRQQVIALAVGAVLAGALGAPPAHAAPDAKAPAASVASPVDVNTATISELTTLPGIGEKRAQAIVDVRQQRGGFKSVDELTEVKGIGPANLEKLRPYLRVGSAAGQ